MSKGLYKFKSPLKKSFGRRSSHFLLPRGARWRIAALCILGFVLGIATGQLYSLLWFSRKSLDNLQRAGRCATTGRQRDACRIHCSGCSGRVGGEGFGAGPRPAGAPHSGRHVIDRRAPPRRPRNRYYAGRTDVSDPSPKCCIAEDCLANDQGRHAVITSLRTNKYLPLVQVCACRWVDRRTKGGFAGLHERLHALHAISCAAGCLPLRGCRLSGSARRYAGSAHLPEVHRWLSCPGWRPARHLAVL